MMVLLIELNVFLTRCMLRAGLKCFDSQRISHWWMASTASFLDKLYNALRLLREEIYCRTANGKGDATPAYLYFGVLTTTGSDKP